MSWRNESYNHSLASKGVSTRERMKNNILPNYDWEKDFESKYAINYAYRNIEVGDEEETRLLYDIDDWIESFKREGMSEEDVEKIRTALNKIDKGNIDWRERATLLEKASNILSKYITAPKLAKSDTIGDWDVWEHIVLGDLQDDPEVVEETLADVHYEQYPTLKDAKMRINQIKENLKRGVYNE